MTEIEKLAKAREAIHKGQKSQRILSKNYQLIGLAGEAEFERVFGIKMDRSLKPQGDGGHDFTLPMGTIDVKTARNAYNLLRETNTKHPADILVLAQYNGNGKAHLVGWAYDWEMTQCPHKDFGYGIDNYYKPRDKLRPIKELLDLKNNPMNSEKM